MQNALKVIPAERISSTRDGSLHASDSGLPIRVSYRAQMANSSKA